jgi:hypothetical protein
LVVLLSPRERLARAAFRYHHLWPLETVSALWSVFTVWRRSDRPLGLEVAMQTWIERCCGLDVHQAVIVACLACGKTGWKVVREVRRFPTTTGLLALRDWLKAAGCTHVGPMRIGSAALAGRQSASPKVAAQAAASKNAPRSIIYVLSSREVRVGRRVSAGRPLP